jgi:transposase
VRRDVAAVEVALILPWSNGQLEGQINRVKVIKRVGYGRAKFDLLQRRGMRAPIMGPMDEQEAWRQRMHRE